MARFVPLQPGEPIGVVALSGPVEPGRLAAGLAALRRWGHPLVLADNLRSRAGYLAGTDAERLAGLEGVLGHGARVLIAARGGYGVTRLLPRLPWSRLETAGACVVGYSDLTALLNPLAALGVAQVHGPMVASGLARPRNASRLRRVLTAELAGRELLRFDRSQVVRPGTAVGPLWGGTLSLLEALVGTPFEPDLEGGVLLLEEVNEPPYRVDRMLTHLAASARFRGVKALIVGSLRGCGWTRTRAAEWRRLLLEALPADVPVVMGLPFGHRAANMAVPIGVPVDLDTRRGRVAWSE